MLKSTVNLAVLSIARDRSIHTFPKGNRAICNENSDIQYSN